MLRLTNTWHFVESKYLKREATIALQSSLNVFEPTLILIKNAALSKRSTKCRIK